MSEEMQNTAPAEPIEQPQEVAQEPVQERPEPASEPAKAEVEKPRTRREAIEAALKATSGDEKPEVSDGERPRGPDGKFIAKDGEKPAEATPEAQKPVEAAKIEDKLGEAPTRFSADAKAAWKDAPDAIKGEIKRAITELEGGIRQYQQAVEPLKPFFDMAKQHGTTVQDALGSYVRMEQALRNEATRPQALRALAQNMGMAPADLAAALTGQQPQGDGNEKDRQIVGLTQKISALEAQLGQLGQTVTQTREQAIHQDVQRFAADKPRFDELSSEIVRLLETGYASDLQDAYEKAERLNPAPQPAAPPPPAPAPQPRPALSVTGAPNAGSNPGNRQPSATRREAIARAMQGAGLS